MVLILFLVQSQPLAVVALDLNNQVMVPNQEAQVAVAEFQQAPVHQVKVILVAQ